MTSHPGSGLCTALTLTLASCATPPGRASDALPARFEAILRSYEAAWQARDAAALTDLFTEDGWVMSSGRPPAHGHDAIAKRYQGSGGPLALRCLHWEQQGDLAIILGGYGRSRGKPDSGKFTLTLRRGEDGRLSLIHI